MIHRIVAPLSLLLLAACAGSPGTPSVGQTASRAPLPSGGCYDGPLVVDVNGANHDLTRTGPTTFIVSGPIFSALEIDLSTDGDAVYIKTNEGPKRLDGEPGSCRLSGQGALRTPNRGLPLSIAIAPAV